LCLFWCCVCLCCCLFWFLFCHCCYFCCSNLSLAPLFTHLCGPEPSHLHSPFPSPYTMEAPTPTYADLVLIGGGHAHVHLLKMFGMLPYKALLAGIRLTLITRDINTPYSGMLPGYVAGHYTSTECHLDLSKLCSFSNFRLIHAEATAITLNTPTATSGLVHLSSSRPPLRFDCLSVDIGSSPTLSPLATINITPVKPIDSFSTRFHDLLRRATDHDATHGTPFRLIIVGGGAGGIELTLSLQHRLRALFTDLDRDPGLVDVCIVNRSQTLLPAHSDGVRTIFKRILKERDVSSSERAHSRLRAFCPNYSLH